MDSEGTKLNTQWQNSVEQLLKRWGEQASGLRLLHYNAFYKFRSKNIGITIPVIILQSLAGSASIGFNTLFPEDIQHYAQIIVGAVSLTTSILITINNFSPIITICRFIRQNTAYNQTDDIIIFKTTK